MKSKILIFGREPAAIVATIEAALALAVAFFLPISSGQVGLIMAVVTAALAVYTAVVTDQRLLAVVVGLVKAVLALAVGFGLHLSPEQAAGIIAFVTVAMGLFNRQQTSPVVAKPGVHAVKRE